MHRIKNRLKFLLCFIALSCAPIGAQAQGLMIVRDTEIESTLRMWSSPVFRAAGLDPAAVKIILVQNDKINAFVAGGSNIFFYTGLITRAKNPGEVIGVMAHETGHIAGGHLIRTRDALERASYESIIGAMIGIGAAIATGEAGAASAIVMGSSTVAQRRFLSHSRVQESSADQAALSFMEQAQINPTGLLTFLETLKSEIYMPTNQQSEYIQTHPLVENRIEALQTRIAASPFNATPYPAEWEEQLARMKAKIVAFVNPAQVPWVYSDRDMSMAARYARAIAAYRNNQVEQALSLADGLLEAEPNNPFFLELKGQMLLEFGRGREAAPLYKRALDIKPNAGLIRMALAHAMIESKGGEDDLRAAIKHLERAMVDEPRASNAHRFLATAYGRLGDQNMARVHLAEEAVMQRRLSYAREQAQAVLSNAQQGSKAHIMAKDILSFVEMNEKG